jgi:hypothetical protein
MMQWYKDGRPIGDDDLADLAQTDTDTVCEFAGITFRFTAETVSGHSLRRLESGGGTAVLALRELRPVDPDRAIYVVDFADAHGLEGLGCENDRRTCARADETACRAARRYVGLELFHRAQEMIDLTQAA